MQKPHRYQRIEEVRRAIGPIPISRGQFGVIERPRGELREEA
jgi:hypothetical protein